MEVVAMSSNAPFKREVHEWNHIDAKTGALLSGRAEANRYVNGNINTYGKSLLQSLETSDGTQHKQHKQMNILQTITSTGSALQVVRAQTIQTSHSSASSRRAITSTTYSSHYTNGGTTANNPPSNGSGGDLLSIPRALHHETTAHSPTTEISSRMKALLSSTHFNAAANVHTSNTAAIPNDNHLFHHHHHHHHANNDIDQRMMKNNFDVGMEEQSRQKRINEMLYGNNNGVSKESFGLLRGKSASIEELANIDDDDDDLKPYEWKRVSKIRRSLQFPTTETKRINFHHRPSRPVDLPENSVNVWKIRQDIENGCMSLPRNTAMKMALNNNQGDDFVALNSILKEASLMDSLNSNHSNEHSTTAKDECVTAESLQDIRKRLRKMDKFNRGFVAPSLPKEPNFSLEQNCKSLELRKNKERDINADEWLNRRKSYGFEKMHQPSESLSGAVESSVDSGLGLSRSSDLPSNWSPTNAASSEPQRTIITFGNDKSKPATTSISLFNHAAAAGDAKPIPLRRTAIGNHKKIDDDLKRHSIAVDEKIDEHYQQRNGAVDRKISLVNLNGRYEEKSLVDGRQKKVEFCKTEIHFAADSGRVNIVETNTKPPPTNNFRRRRRTSGGNSTTLDSEYPSKSQQQELQIEDDAVDADENGKVTTTIGSVYDNAGNLKESDTDEGQSEDGLRGILKNKPIKPRPYHLGENLESGSSLWGVRLKPVENQHTTWRHSADLESAISKKSVTEDALDVEFKNLVKAIDDKAPATLNLNQFQSTVSSNGYSTKINLSSLPTIQQHPAPSTSIATSNKDTTSSLFTAVAAANTTHIPIPSSTFTSFTDSRHSNNGNKNDDKDQQQKGHHKISIDLKLPHPSSMNTIMDELKSTSLIIKTMKSTSYFDDAMKHLERESPFIRSSSLRLTNESLPKSSSTNSMFYRNKPNPPVHRYSSSLDGDYGILDGKNNATESKSRDDDFDFLNGFLEENRKFQLSIAQRHQTVKEEGKEVEEEKHQQQPPIAAPRLKKIMNSSQQLSQQLSQLKHLYDNENDSDEDNAKADEEVKSFLSKTEDEKSTELSGSWSRVRVKKIASAFQHQKSLKTSTSATDSSKWPKTPLTSLYENSTSTSSSSSFKVPIEATPRTSKIQIGVNHEKVNSNIYSNVQQQDKSVKVNIQNFESLTPSLSRSNSLRVKKEDLTTPKLSTGTRQLKAHELTYFGIKSAPSTIMSNPIETSIMKSSFVHLSNSNNKNNSKSKTNPTTTSKVIINHHHQKPDLIMHHPHAPSSVTPEKKSMIEALDTCIDETKNLEPLYENLYNNNSNHKQHYDRKSDLKRDEKILFELSRAADEIMETCKEMYQHDSDEKRRKSQSISNGTITCLETISECNEGRHQRALTENEAKTMKSKGVQVSRNFEDSLRRYHRTPQQRTSSQSSVESLPQKSSKVSSPATSSLITTRIKRGTVVTKSTESKSSSATTASNRKRENGNGSDASRRIHRVCSRERMQKSNASSSESDLPNSSVETPRRPRRTKVLKHHRSEENGKDEKKSNANRSATTETSSRRHISHSSPGVRASAESKVRSSVNKSSSSSVNPNSSLSSPPGNPTSSSRKSSRR